MFYVNGHHLLCRAAHIILSRFWKKTDIVETGINCNNFSETVTLFYRETGLWRDSKWTAKVWRKYCPACLIYLPWEWWLESLLSLKRQEKWVVLGHSNHLNGGCSAHPTLLKERWGTAILLSVFLVSRNGDTAYFEAGEPPSEEEFWWGGFWRNNYPQLDNFYVFSHPIYLYPGPPYYITFLILPERTVWKLFRNRLAAWEWHADSQFCSIDQSREES